MSQERNFANGDKVSYSEYPDLDFSVKSIYVHQPHHSINPQSRVIAKALVENKTFEIDAPDYYFTYAGEKQCAANTY